MTPARLEIANLSKSFGVTRALVDVSMDVRPGEVLAIVGENGAGKSTLLKIMSGAERPDAGAMHLDGMAYVPRNPHDARRLGVATIYQELALAPHLDVASNVWLGMERTRGGFLQFGMERERVRQVLAMLNHADVRPEQLVRRLTPAARQLVEVARALAFDARVLVLDEPTSSLTHHDSERLMRILRQLRDDGMSIVYVSHFLEEVERIADRYVVLRDGAVVASGDIRQTSRGDLIRAMVGRNLGDLYPPRQEHRGKPILSVQGLSGRRMPSDASFMLHAGEILGIFGLVGAGRTELLRCLYGLDERRRGRIVLEGRDLSKAPPHAMLAAGFGMVSEDRKNEGLALNLSVEENLTAGGMGHYATGGWLNVRARRHAVVPWLERLGVRHESPSQPINRLSGGNQQKVALGRLLHHGVSVLLLDEPTRGVDVGSKAALYRLIAELAREGKGIVFVSSYLPELLGTCHALAVMNRGRLSKTRPVQEWTEESIMASATAGETVP